MNPLGYLFFTVFMALVVCGIVKAIEWRVKKVHKQLHSKESDNE